MSENLRDGFHSRKFNPINLISISQIASQFRLGRVLKPSQYFLPIFVYLSIGGVPVKAMLDTGSDFSLVSSTLAAGLPFHQRSPLSLWSVNSQAVIVLGMCLLQADVEGHNVQMVVHVVKDLPYQLLLGRDFMKTYLASIDFEKWEPVFRPKDEVVSQFPSILTSQHNLEEPSHDMTLPGVTVATLTDCEIPPKATHCFRFPVDYQGCLQPLQFLEKNIMSSPSLRVEDSFVESGVATVKVLNTHSESVLVPRELILGTCSFLSEDKLATTSEVIFPFDWIKGSDIPRRVLPLLEQYRQKINLRNYDITLPEAEIKLSMNRPIYRKPYRLSEEKRRFVLEQYRIWKDSGIIEDTTSPYASPIVVVDKKSVPGELPFRLCGDFTGINPYIIPEHFPLPRVEDLIYELRGAKFFSIIDLRRAYLQIPLAERDRHVTAVVSPDVQFQFRKVPFGLCISASIMQRIMHQLLGQYRGNFLTVYQDDICVYSGTEEKHLEHLERVLAVLGSAGLQIALPKCKFLQNSISYLGHEVDGFSVRPLSANIDPVLSWVRPKNPKQIKQILGAASYYRKFIERFAERTHHLRSLLKKGAKFLWSEDCEKEFSQIKTALTSKPILQHFRPELRTQLKTDASMNAIAAILVQFDDRGEHVVAYASQALSAQQQKWSAIERECFAVVWGMKHFDVYLDGQQFELVVDNHALCKLFSLKNPSPKLTGWMLQVQDRKFEIKFRPGSQHCDVDCLSRHGFVQSCSSVAMFVSGEEIGLAQVGEKNSWDHSLRSRLEEVDGLWSLRKGGESPLIKDLILVYVPECLRNKLIQTAHDDALSGHFGVNKVWMKLKNKYYWPGMRGDIAKYVGSCVACQARAHSNRKPYGYLQNIVVSQIFHVVAIDFVENLNRTQRGNEHIVVAIDLFSKFVIAMPLTQLNALNTANFILNEIVLRYGPPLRLLSDRGVQFRSDLVRNFLKMLEINQVNTTSYHPQCDGQTESANKTIIQLLAKMAGQNYGNWDRMLPYVVHQYNTTVQDSTGFAPYEVLFGCSPRLPHLEVRDQEVASGTVLDRMLLGFDYIRKIANQNLEKARKKQKSQYDRDRSDIDFRVGDRVMLVDLKIKSAGRKLYPKNLGPYTVLKKSSPVNYVLRLDDGVSVDTFHVSRLRHFYAREETADPVSGQQPKTQEEEQLEDYRFDQPIPPRQLRPRVGLVSQELDRVTRGNVWHSVPPCTIL